MALTTILLSVILAQSTASLWISRSNRRSISALQKSGNAEANLLLALVSAVTVATDNEEAPPAEPTRNDATGIREGVKVPFWASERITARLTRISRLRSQVAGELRGILRDLGAPEASEPSASTKVTD